MEIRLQKAIANAGITSRRKAEELIEQGRVKVNGEIIRKQGVLVDPDQDSILVEGKQIAKKNVQKKYVYALYKPKSCISTLHDPQERDTIVNYFPKNKGRLFPVGRLDYDAEGLLLVTNDGDLAQMISHPTNHVWKTYFVKVKGVFDPKLIPKLRKGPVFGGKKRQPVEVKVIHVINNAKTWLEVSLQEGTNRHIKKMLWAYQYDVEKIKRISIHNISLGDLNPGEHRLLEEEELKSLIEYVQESPSKK